MKSRLSFIVSVVLLSVTLTSCGPENHVDISLRGPWILYVDNSKTLADWPILIAMAPSVHDPTNPWPHQPPSVSNGAAYFLDDPNPPTDSQIYCLMFDGKCARKGTGSLDPDDYAKPNPVSAHIPSGKANWDWVTASRQNHAPTLILPVPDSYSADTAWPMRFAPQFDVTGKLYKDSKTEDTYSTGVVLHYTKGPNSFDLKLCPNGQQVPSSTPNAQPSLTITNCMNSPNLPHTQQANNGSLHIEIKAPDTNWSCDPHVRRVYPAMLKLIGTYPGPSANWAVIDPAHGFNDDGSPAYDVYPDGHTSPPADPNNSAPSPYCLEHDWQGGYKDTRYVASGGGEAGTKSEMKNLMKGEMKNAELEPQPCNGWAGCVQALVKNINAGNVNLDSVSQKNKDNDDAVRQFKEALREIKTDGNDPELFRFPRLAQMRRLDDDIVLLGQLQRSNNWGAERSPTSKSLLPLPLPILDPILRVLIRLETFPDPYTKTGGDCLAPTTVLTDK